MRLLLEAAHEALEAAAADAELLARAASSRRPSQAELARPPPTAGRADGTVAFFCAEYGIHRSLPIYSGGLGALAGDILKEASDRALPLVAVGLMYRQGYFRQRIDAPGWQHEYWVDTDPDRLPAALVTADDGAPLTITRPGRRQRRHRAGVAGRRRPRAALLLDADRPENDAVARWITSRLYVGDPEARLAQYVAARRRRHARARGARHRPGGRAPQRGPRRVRRARAGRARTARRRVARRGARAAARARTVFTTHTPVPGRQRHLPGRPGRARRCAATCRASSASTPRSSSGSGARTPTTGDEPFGVTQFALRTQPRGQRREPPPRRGRARDVERAVARPRGRRRADHATSRTACTCPPGSAARCAQLLDRHLGEGWCGRAADPAHMGAAWTTIPDEELWDARARAAAALISHVRERSVRDRLGRGDTLDYARRGRALRPGRADDRVRAPPRDVQAPRTCSSGPARRATAPAGRRHARCSSLIAGKAHPRDEEGKRLVQHLFAVQGRRGRRRPRRLPRRLRPRERGAPRAAAATCGSTSRARRWRRAARAA